jgi:5-methylcytosine-specific restriction endonuclease McrA
LCGKLLDGQRKDVHVDHKIPPSRLGPAGSEAYLTAHQDQENWQLSCPRCNMRKQDR